MKPLEKIDALPAEQQEELTHWVLTLTIKEAGERLLKKFGADICPSTLNRYRHRCLVTKYLDTSPESAQARAELIRAAASGKPNFSQTTVDLLEKQAFELAFSAHEQEARDALKDLFNLVHQYKNYSIRERMASLQERKFEFRQKEAEAKQKKRSAQAEALLKDILCSTPEEPDPVPTEAPQLAPLPVASSAVVAAPAPVPVPVAAPAPNPWLAFPQPIPPNTESNPFPRPRITTPPEPRTLPEPVPAPCEPIQSELPKSGSDKLHPELAAILAKPYKKRNEREKLIASLPSGFDPHIKIDDERTWPHFYFFLRRSGFYAALNYMLQRRCRVVTPAFKFPPGVLCIDPEIPHSHDCIDYRESLNDHDIPHLQEHPITGERLPEFVRENSPIPSP